MALPKLDTPIHTLVLPSTGQEIKYRPFLVKEQKLLIDVLKPLPKPIINKIIKKEEKKPKKNIVLKKEKKNGDIILPKKKPLIAGSKKKKDKKNFYKSSQEITK